MKSKHSGTLLIKSPIGPKKFGRINGVALLMRVLLQENVWWFLSGGKKKGHNNVVAMRRGFTVEFKMKLELKSRL